MRYYGSVEAQRTFPGYIPSVGEAPAYISLMSPRCASLHDAMRVAPVHGLKSDDAKNMRKEYDAKCREDESRARLQWSDEVTQKRDAKLAAEGAKQRRLTQSREQIERCGELKRINKLKRQRQGMTEGELRDLERAEENYRNRCG